MKGAFGTLYLCTASHCVLPYSSGGGPADQSTLFTAALCNVVPSPLILPTLSMCRTQQVDNRGSANRGLGMAANLVLTGVAAPAPIAGLPHILQPHQQQQEDPLSCLGMLQFLGAPAVMHESSNILAEQQQQQGQLYDIQAMSSDPSYPAATAADMLTDYHAASKLGLNTNPMLQGYDPANTACNNSWPEQTAAIATRDTSSGPSSSPPGSGSYNDDAAANISSSTAAAAGHVDLAALEADAAATVAAVESKDIHPAAAMPPTAVAADVLTDMPMADSAIQPEPPTVVPAEGKALVLPKITVTEDALQPTQGMGPLLSLQVCTGSYASLVWICDACLPVYVTSPEYQLCLQHPPPLCRTQ